MRTTSGRTPIPHGTPNGYVYHRCRCYWCTQANTERSLEQRRKREARRVPGRDGRLVTTADVPHGDVCTYRNWGCRCRPCTTAHTSELYEYRQRRREQARAAMRAATTGGR